MSEYACDGCNKFFSGDWNQAAALGWKQRKFMENNPKSAGWWAVTGCPVCSTDGAFEAACIRLGSSIFKDV